MLVVVAAVVIFLAAEMLPVLVALVVAGLAHQLQQVPAESCERAEGTKLNYTDRIS